MRIPSKLTHGMNLFRDGMRVINEIIDYLASSRVIGDNRTIAVNESFGGIVISAIQKQSGGGGAGAEAYNRYFKVTNASTEADGLQVKVAFGRCRVADKYFAVPAITEENDYTIKKITTGGYLYFQSVVDENEEAQQPTIEFSENMYEYESGYCKHLLATVNLNDEADAIASIEPQDDGYIVDTIYGICNEEEEA